MRHYTAENGDWYDGEYNWEDYDQEWYPDEPEASAEQEPNRTYGPD